MSNSAWYGAAVAACSVFVAMLARKFFGHVKKESDRIFADRGYIFPPPPKHSKGFKAGYQLARFVSRRLAS
jgi:hypothetical protein